MPTVPGTCTVQKNGLEIGEENQEIDDECHISKMRSRINTAGAGGMAPNAPYRYNRDTGTRANAQGNGGGSGGSGGGGGGDGGGDSYTSVSYERAPGAAQKVGKSLQGLLFGPVLIFFGCLLLWHNEGWAIKTHRSLNEAIDAFVSIQNAKAPPLDEYQSRLVHLADKIQVDAPVVDDRFDLSRQAVSLTRNVEIYQWVESIKKERHKHQNGETEVREIVNYNKNWVKGRVGSENFRHARGHENVGDLPLPSDTFRAAQVSMGAYVLSDILKNQIKQSAQVPISQVKTLPEGAAISGNSVYIPRGGAQQAQAVLPGDLSQAVEEQILKIDGQETRMYIVKATGDSYTSRERAMQAAKAVVPSQQQERQIFNSADGPAIGDVRISFSEIPCTYVSVLAKLSGNILTKWPSKQGAGYDVAILTQDSTSAHDMISSEKAANTVKTWLFRGLGWLLNFIGFSWITSIISTTANLTLNWIPFLGPMASSIISLGLTVANLILANCVTLIVGSIAWVAYRPLIGLSMLAGSIGLFYTASQAGKGQYGGTFMGKKTKANF
jgi:hypothetical protein